jgi:hydrogenase maturation protein HypF
LKNTIGLLQDGQVTLSQHLGDLEDARTADEFERTIALYTDLFAHRPRSVAVDLHPDYRSTRFGRQLAVSGKMPVEAVQHHHAHIASVLAENGFGLDEGAVLGIALDGLGFGTDGTIWGGEFLLADYREFRRLGCLKPVTMPGATQSILEPWRNTYAHIVSHFGWEGFLRDYASLELADRLQGKSLDMLAVMIERGLNSPLTSSCGRLFDAVSAALGVCRGSIGYEGQAAIELEVLALNAAKDTGRAYHLEQQPRGDMDILDPAPMWRMLFDDLAGAVDRSIVAARFHAGLAQSVASMAETLAGRNALQTVALSGGVLQNRTLFEALLGKLQRSGLRVLTHRQVPSNDGGLALGQAAVAAARQLARRGS